MNTSASSSSSVPQDATTSYLSTSLSRGNITEDHAAMAAAPSSASLSGRVMSSSLQRPTRSQPSPPAANPPQPRAPIRSSAGFCFGSCMACCCCFSGGGGGRGPHRRSGRGCCAHLASSLRTCLRGPNSVFARHPYLTRILSMALLFIVCWLFGFIMIVACEATYGTLYGFLSYKDKWFTVYLLPQLLGLEFFIIMAVLYRRLRMTSVWPTAVLGIYACYYWISLLFIAVGSGTTKLEEFSDTTDVVTLAVAYLCINVIYSVGILVLVAGVVSILYAVRRGIIAFLAASPVGTGSCCKPSQRPPPLQQHDLIAHFGPVSPDPSVGPGSVLTASSSPMGPHQLGSHPAHGVSFGPGAGSLTAGPLAPGTRSPSFGRLPSSATQQPMWTYHSHLLNNSNPRQQPLQQPQQQSLQRQLSRPLPSGYPSNTLVSSTSYSSPSSPGQHTAAGNGSSRDNARSAFVYPMQERSLRMSSTGAWGSANVV